MQFVTDRFLDCLRYGGKRISYVRTIDTDGAPVHMLPIKTGHVRVNGDGSIRRDLDCTAYSDVIDLIPRDGESIINTIGAEVRVDSGWRYPDGTEELLRCGVFRISNATVQRQPNGLEINITGLDRASVVQGQSSNSVSIYSGTDPSVAITKIVQSKYPQAKFNLAGSGVENFKLGNLFYQAQTDLWEEARNVAKSVGMDLFFDTAGWLAMGGPLQRGSAERVLEYNIVYPIGSLQRVVNGDNIYNGVIVIGKHSAGTSYGEAWITNQESPFSVTGLLGKKPKVIESELAGTNAQAMVMARAELAKILGPADGIEFTCIPNASMDVGDLIGMHDTDSGTRGRFHVLSFDLPLGAVDGDMSVQAGRPVE